MTDSARVRSAGAQARAARARLLQTLGEVQERLNPKLIASNAVEGVREGAANAAQRTVEEARRRPAVVAAIAGGLALFLARKPLARLLRRHRKDQAPAPNLSAPPAGESTSRSAATYLTEERASAPEKGPVQ